MVGAEEGVTEVSHSHKGGPEQKPAQSAQLHVGGGEGVVGAGAGAAVAGLSLQQARSH